MPTLDTVKRAPLGIRAFLKREGFDFKSNPRRSNERIYKLLSPSGKVAWDTYLCKTILIEQDCDIRRC